MPIYMNINGIEGESFSEGHQGWFDVFSFSFGESNPRPTGGGNGGGAGSGRVSMSDFQITKPCGKGSPLLMLACASGRHLPAVQFDITVSNSDHGDQILQRYVLNDCFITAFETSGDGNSRPTESLSLNFTKIDMLERYTNADGTVQNQEVFWDVRSNTGGTR
jgi:type VI secretion system secreted protein Hcp